MLEHFIHKRPAADHRAIREIVYCLQISGTRVRPIEPSGESLQQPFHESAQIMHPPGVATMNFLHLMLLVPQLSGGYKFSRRIWWPYPGRTKSVGVTLSSSWRHFSDLLDPPHQRHQTLNAPIDPNYIRLRRLVRGQEVLLPPRKVRQSKALRRIVQFSAIFSLVLRESRIMVVVAIVCVTHHLACPQRIATHNTK
jgi:hypothetical protein